MTSWILIAISAYFLLALNGVADKFLLSRAAKHPVVYAFYVGIASILVLALAPFGLTLPPLWIIIVALLSGAAFVAALLFLYTAIQRTSISRVLPIEGGFVPVFTLLFAYPILGAGLSGWQWLAFIFLVVGAVVISIKKENGSWQSKALQSAIVAAVFFAFSFVLSKYVYDSVNMTFISGLIWTRLGLVLAAVLLLVPKGWRRHILHAPKSARQSNILVFYSAQIAGAAAGLLQNYAIAVGNVIMVNALQGTQYAFTLILTTLLSLHFPKVLKERVTAGIMLQKIFAIILITVGLVLLGR